MKVFALGDLHLSFGRPKPMDIYGELWRDHPSKIAAAWDEAVGPDDVVLVAGDISWARTLEEAQPDLAFIAERTGRRKILLRGNHDSWWRSAAKVRAALPDGLAALHQDAMRIEPGVVVCGARGWDGPGAPRFDPERDASIFERERRRLERSLERAAALREGTDALVAVLHYPPCGPGPDADRSVLELLRDAGVDVAVYGHLHGAEDHAWAPRGRLGGVELRFVAADWLAFRPLAVWEQGRGVLPDPGPDAAGRPGAVRPA